MFSATSPFSLSFFPPTLHGEEPHFFFKPGEAGSPVVDSFPFLSLISRKFESRDLFSCSSSIFLDFHA